MRKQAGRLWGEKTGDRGHGGRGVSGHVESAQRARSIRPRQKSWPMSPLLISQGLDSENKIVAAAVIREDPTIHPLPST